MSRKVANARWPWWPSSCSRSSPGCRPRERSVRRNVGHVKTWPVVLGAPHRHRGSASSWPKRAWYSEKSPCPVLSAMRRCSVVRGRESSGGGPSHGRSHRVYDGGVFRIHHRAKRALRSLFMGRLRWVRVMAPTESGCWVAPSLAWVSAASLPAISVCPGAHCMEEVGGRMRET